MSSYTRSTTIRRPPTVVFDFLSDLRNELHWNPDAVIVDKLTDGDIGVGTRFRARWRRTQPTEVEVISFDPPRSWATRSAAMGMLVETTGVVTSHPDGAVYAVTIVATGSGIGRLLAPLAARVMERGEERHMANIRMALETA